MNFNQVLLIFLAGHCALALAHSAAANHDDNDDELVDRGFTEFISGLLERVHNSTIQTIHEEKESVTNAVSSVKGALGSMAVAGLDGVRAAWEFGWLIPKIGLNVITSNDTESAIKDPIQHSRETLKQAIESMRNAVSGSFAAGLDTAKATWDLTFVFPKWGVNLFAEQKEQLEAALRVTYEQEKESINRAIQSVLEAGGEMAGMGQELIKATWDLSTVVPKIAAEIIGEDSDRIDEVLRLRLNEVGESAQRALDSVKHAGHQLASAGIDVAKAGFDLSTAIPKYGFNLMNMRPEDKQNLEAVVKERVDLAEGSIRQAMESVQRMMAEVEVASKDAANAGHALSRALRPRVQSGLASGSNQLSEKEQEKLESFGKIFETIQQIGAKVASAGTGVTKAGHDLSEKVPKLGYGFLEEQKDLFDRTVLASFRKQREDMRNVLESVRDAGKKIFTAGKQLVRSSWEVALSFPKYGLQAIGAMRDKAVEGANRRE